MPVRSTTNAHVLNVVLLLGLANELYYGKLEAGRLVRDRLWFDENVPKVISHHPLRTMFGWIDADDGESFTTPPSGREAR